MPELLPVASNCRPQRKLGLSAQLRDKTDNEINCTLTHLTVHPSCNMPHCGQEHYELVGRALEAAPALPGCAGSGALSPAGGLASC